MEIRWTEMILQVLFGGGLIVLTFWLLATKGKTWSHSRLVGFWVGFAFGLVLGFLKGLDDFSVSLAVGVFLGCLFGLIFSGLIGLLKIK